MMVRVQLYVELRMPDHMQGDKVARGIGDLIEEFQRNLKSDDELYGLGRVVRTECVGVEPEPS